MRGMAQGAQEAQQTGNQYGLINFHEISLFSLKYRYPAIPFAILPSWNKTQASKS